MLRLAIDLAEGDQVACNIRPSAAMVFPPDDQTPGIEE